MIFDVFMYAGESTLLDIRWLELAAEWDDVQMIALEGVNTFTGQRRQLSELTVPIDRPVIYNPHHEDPWVNERNQRNAARDCLSRYPIMDDDVVIISDIDEVPKRSAIMQYKPEFGRCSLVMDQMYYYLDALHSRQTWRHPKITTWADLKSSTADEIRNSGTAIGLLDAGYHFSYMGGEVAILEKLAAFSHQEPRVQHLAAPGVLNDKLTRLEAPWNDDPLTIIDLKELPVCIQRGLINTDKYVLQRR